MHPIPFVRKNRTLNIGTPEKAAPGGKAGLESPVFCHLPPVHAPFGMGARAKPTGDGLDAVNPAPHADSTLARNSKMDSPGLG